MVAAPISSHKVIRNGEFKMTVSVMLDLETWGTEPGCDIRSIGACVFDPVTGAYGVTGGNNVFYIACDNPVWERAVFDLDERDERWHTHHDATNDCWRKYPLHRDPRTVQWWSEQSDEAQAAFADPVDLKEALRRFIQWLDDLTWRWGQDLPSEVEKRTNLRLWSHGPAFDPPILAAAYLACGLPVPWHYRAPRDTRTAFDMAGIDDHSAWLKQHPGPLVVAHHALDDSICQARAVCGAYRGVRRWRNTSNENDGLVSHLNNIARDIEDEGDRAYFGSTNDADLLREIAGDLDAGRFERDYDTPDAADDAADAAWRDHYGSDGA